MSDEETKNIAPKSEAAIVEKQTATQTAAAIKDPDFPENDDDDEYLQDDGFFWLTQRVIWGLIKSLMIIFIIGGMIWVIWWPDSPKSTAEEKTEPISIASSSDIPVAQSPPEQVAPPVVEALPAEAVSPVDITASVSALISHSIAWLQETKYFAENHTTVINQASNIDQRQTLAAQTLAVANNLLLRGQQLRSLLQTQLSATNAQVNQYNDVLAQSKNDFWQGMQAGSSSEVLHAEDQKSQARLQLAILVTRQETFQVLFKNITNFLILLRQQSIPLLSPSLEIRSSSQ